MRYDFTPEQRAWRDEIRAFIRDHITPEMLDEQREAGNEGRGPLAQQFIVTLRDKGYWGIAWPPEYGGLGRSAIDQWIFGTQPSIWLERFHHPWLTEILFISYSLFFFWQVALGTLLFLKKRQDFHAYVLLVVAFYLLSYVMYLMVPAIGPRFDLLSQYQYPLTGVFLAKHIEASFIDIPMVRDCFPSGHTGLTLLTLYQAWRSGMKKFFFIMLPFGVLLIFSTVYCRFHYVVDLLCALPFLTGILLLRHGLLTALPDGITLPLRRRALARASA